LNMIQRLAMYLTELRAREFFFFQTDIYFLNSQETRNLL
jgi:hypothetical protein